MHAPATTEQSADIHTPTTMMTIFANAFQLDSERSIFWIKGIYQDRQRQAYANYYFDRLQDAATGQIITIKVPARLKKQVNHGVLYTFKGTIEKDVRPDGVIEPVFVVVEMRQRSGTDHQQSQAVERRVALEQRKANIGFQDVDSQLRAKLERGIKPEVVLLCGTTSEAIDDIKTALGDAAGHYRLAWSNINITDREAIIAAFSDLRNRSADAIVVTRGGGPGLQIFDDVRIAEASMTLSAPLITAIGHARDETLLQKLADKAFATPTALGDHLRTLAEIQTLPSQAEIDSAETTPAQPPSLFLIIIAILITLALGVALGAILL
jgi:hypothetical protein